MKEVHIILSFLLLISQSVSAQLHNLKFQHLSTQDGLSQSNVTCMMQDHKGFLWFGTRDGLNKYDGYSFTTYKNTSSPASISNNYIRSLIEDSNGTIWIATWGGGLNKFDQEKELFTSYQHIPGDSSSISDNFLNKVYEDKAGNIWVGAYKGGINLVNKETNTFTRICQNNSGLSDNNVFEIFEDKKSNFWIGTESGGLNLYNRKTKEFTKYVNDPLNPHSLSHNNIRSILEDEKGNLWIGTYGGGLSYFNVALNTFKRYTYNPENLNSISHNVLFDIEEDNEGNIWIGTENGGLSIFNPHSEEFVSYQNNLSDHLSLSNNSIYSIYKDKHGNMWIGTFSGGINYVNKDNNKFNHFRSSATSNSLSNNNVLCIYEDSQSNIWIGTDGGGLNLYNEKDNSFIHFKKSEKQEDGIAGNYVLGVKEDSDGNIWVGTWGSGLSMYNKKDGKFTHFKNNPSSPQSLSSDNAWVIIEDKDKDIWIGTYFGGLNLYDKKNKSFKSFKHNPKDSNSLSNDNIYTILHDSRGLLWIGTDGGGLNSFDKKTGKFTQYLHDKKKNSISHNIVSCIFEDKKGNLWIGTDAGLNYLDYNSKQFTSYFVEDGLPNNMVFGILEDDSNNLWVSTNKGLSKFNPEQFTFKNYTVADGLQHNEFKRQAFCKSKSGKLYFGGINGFNVFEPEKIRDYKFDPPLVLTGFHLFNNPVPISSKENGINSPLSKHISYTDMIVLPYAQSIISFEFASLNFSIEEKKKYMYMLEGFDKGWNNIGTKRSITYTNLNPGEYKLIIKGLNNDGEWSKDSTQLGLIIQPPYWKAWWFYLIILAVFANCIFAFIKIRIQVINKQKLALEKQVKERTSELQALNGELIEQATEIYNQREQLKELYDDVKESIRAAQVIQQSILPSEEYMKAYLPESFVLNKPKDVVSGDFYWFDVKDDKIIIAVVDCTGHGVSGAFMSINGHHLLNQAIYPYENLVASEILERLNNGILKEFNHQTQEPIIKDGMDIALCIIDKKTNQLQFAGANNPVYILRNKKLIQIKGSRFSIGMAFLGREKRFTNHEFNLQKDDVVYMFSDGYVDQVGGEKGGKFMYPRFRELLLNIGNENMGKQLEALEKNLLNWKKEEEQLDDILIVAFKVS